MNCFVFLVFPFSAEGMLSITYSISAIGLHIRAILHWIRSESALLLLITRFEIFNVLKCPINPVTLGGKNQSFNIQNLIAIVWS